MKPQHVSRNVSGSQGCSCMWNEALPHGQAATSLWAFATGWRFRVSLCCKSESILRRQPQGPQPNQTFVLCFGGAALEMSGGCVVSSPSYVTLDA